MVHFWRKNQNAYLSRDHFGDSKSRRYFKAESIEVFKFCCRQSKLRSEKIDGHLPGLPIFSNFSTRILYDVIPSDEFRNQPKIIARFIRQRLHR